MKPDWEIDLSICTTGCIVERTGHSVRDTASVIANDLYPNEAEFDGRAGFSVDNVRERIRASEYGEMTSRAAPASVHAWADSTALI
ncbi:MAG TPA: hypothetical protein VJN92_19975 [Candidatus Acidoferrum sp.]|nr:hypothetical protein [Candidatus Acidoferrum sp.]